MQEVIKTIYEAVILVVIVVILFLQSWRASLIPILAIPVSLVGTFSVLAALGYSLNNLSLFGLVLAVGIVVDDAIVVVENVERNLRLGLQSARCRKRTMDAVGGALVAIALVLDRGRSCRRRSSPASSGQFFRQFAVTITAATRISCFVSLTLSPALCAVLFKPHDHHPAKRQRSSRVDSGLLWRLQRVFDRLSGGYGTLTRRLVRLVDADAGGLCGADRASPAGNSAGHPPASFRSRTRAISSPSSSCRQDRRWHVPMR